jgi:5-carboxymethyl-2-hydroxymuconate isomerase
MPHTILEYSDNVVQPLDVQAFWGRLHPVLVDTARVRLQDIKSRAYRCEDFRMGDGSPDCAFAHLTISLLEGRDPDTLARIGRAALELLQAQFARTLAQRRCDLTVELTGMRKDCYFKASSCGG